MKNSESPRRLSDLQMPAHLVEFLAGPEEFVALGELADDLSGVCRRRLFDAMSLLILPCPNNGKQSPIMTGPVRRAHLIPTSVNRWGAMRWRRDLNHPQLPGHRAGNARYQQELISGDSLRYPWMSPVCCQYVAVIDLIPACHSGSLYRECSVSRRVGKMWAGLTAVIAHQIPRIDSWWHSAPRPL